jgi:hypothetical protein
MHNHAHVVDKDIDLSKIQPLHQFNKNSKLTTHISVFIVFNMKKES